jgi:hypothetical protein
MEHRWNETDRGKPKYPGKNLSQCHFVHQKSHTDCPGIEPDFRGERSATNRLSHGKAICGLKIHSKNDISLLLFLTSTYNFSVRIFVIFDT